MISAPADGCAVVGSPSSLFSIFPGKDLGTVPAPPPPTQTQTHTESDPLRHGWSCGRGSIF